MQSHYVEKESKETHRVAYKTSILNIARLQGPERRSERLDEGVARPSFPRSPSVSIRSIDSFRIRMRA